jgi:hypothetical protein
VIYYFAPLEYPHLVPLHHPAMDPGCQLSPFFQRYVCGYGIWPRVCVLVCTPRFFYEAGNTGWQDGEEAVELCNGLSRDKISNRVLHNNRLRDLLNRKKVKGWRQWNVSPKSKGSMNSVTVIAKLVVRCALYNLRSSLRFKPGIRSVATARKNEGLLQFRRVSDNNYWIYWSRFVFEDGVYFYVN